MDLFPRRERIDVPHPASRDRLARPESLRVAVVGGGLAGIAAATVLAERGASVTVFEREQFLGGRAGAWTDTLADGTRFEMERGFHAFFRQYHNLRALLRRVDPTLSMLVPMTDYPLLGPDGARESFSGLPTRPPLNLLTLVARTPSLKFREMTGADPRVLLEMLGFDHARTYRTHDHLDARSFLDGLAFPPHARRMLFDVFAHSFFNPEETMSAAEMLMMFHFYFLGNPEGLVFDVARTPFSHCIWNPLRTYLETRNVRIRLGHTVEGLTRDGREWVVVDSTGGSHVADAVVLATTVPALQSIVSRSPDLADRAFRTSIDSLAVTRPFAVWRLWLDRPVNKDRAPFVGTAGLGLLDNISVFDHFESESREWAARSGGSVVELHAYGVDPALGEAHTRTDLLARLHALYPETRSATILDQRWLWKQDCPAFDAGSHALRPGIETRIPGIVLAGDFVRLEAPTALMERATTTGFLAANALLASTGVHGEPVWSIPRRGMVARLAGRLAP